MQQMSPREVRDWLDDPARQQPYLLDVREPWEYEICHVAGSQLMPMQSVPARLQDLPRDQNIVVICHHGARSMQVALFLEQQGFSSVINLSGGVAAWGHQVDPAMAQY